MKKLIWILLTFFMVFGCTSQKTILPQPEQIGYRELLQYNQVWQEAIQILTGHARITLDSPQYSGNFDARIILGGDDSLMLSVTGPLGIDVGKVFIAKSRFVFYNQINNQFYTGTKKDFEGRNFLQFPLEINQLRSVFVAQDKFDVLSKEIFEKRDDQYFLKAANAHQNYKIWFDAENFMIRRVEYYNDSVLLYYKEYDRFQMVNGIYFPISINFVRPEEKQGVSIYFNSLAINDNIDRSEFNIKISDSAKQIDLSLEN